MNENNCETLKESLLPSTSKATKLKSLSNSNDDIEMEEDNDPQDDSLWSIEDDTLFYAQGLMNHSAGKGKSVFVTWNENYLLNFVFKTSAKTRKTSLTKVRLTMPCQNQEREEIEDMLILEMNSLLYMKSGNVYYFSSVKSMHQVEWLSGVRCMASCPQSKFSVIRLICDTERRKSGKLFLEVYQDLPQLGKFSNGWEVLRHSYDISFDLENIFNCDWLDERYTLLSLITCEENLEFLKQLLSMGNTFRPREEKIELVNNQEVYIFTVSGNIFMLIGAILTESDHHHLSNPEIEDYNIQLLNVYASNIECIRIDTKRNLLIVLLQSGHIDIWYKSKKMFGALLHHQHQISYILHYDYRPTNNTFYFTTPEDVIEIQIITSNEDNLEEECVVHETHKDICGMIACTWVESLQQLICLSFNNIFYKLCFERRKQHVNLQESETHFESLNKLYALTEKRVKDLMSRSQVVNALMKQPESLHQAIEEEFQKQQLLAIGSKHEILQRLYQSHIEYHVNIPEINCFPENCKIIQTTFTNSSTSPQNSVYCLIFLTLRKNNDILSSVIHTPQWHLHISDQQHSLLLHVPSNILQKNICLIVQYSLENIHKMLPNLSLNMVTFVNHCSSYISLNFKIILDTNEKTYRHIFSHNVQNLSLFRNFDCDIEYLLKEFNKSKNNKDDTEGIFQVKYCFKITKNELRNIFEKLHIKSIEVEKSEFKLFFLHQYVLELQYDNSKEILTICSQYPEALFYIKLYLIYEIKSSKDVKIDLTKSKDAHQKIMQYQCNVERLYGYLISSDCMDVESSTVSMHLENLRKVYLKLRTEINDIFR